MFRYDYRYIKITDRITFIQVNLFIFNILLIIIVVIIILITQQYRNMQILIRVISRLYDS